MEMEQGLQAQVVMLHREYLKITEENKNKTRINSSSRVSLQDHSVGLILILILSRKKFAQVYVISKRNDFKGMMKNKIKIHLKCL